MIVVGGGECDAESVERPIYTARLVLRGPRQARDIDESRYMFDQLAVVSPIMLALSASTPIHR